MTTTRTKRGGGLLLLAAALVAGAVSLSHMAVAKAFVVVGPTTPPKAAAAAAAAAPARPRSMALGATTTTPSAPTPSSSIRPLACFRLLLPLLLGGGGGGIAASLPAAMAAAEIPAAAATTTMKTAAAAATPKEPTEAQLQAVRDAFRAFDGRDLAKADRLFDRSVKAWEELNRPRDELAALLKARGNVRCDLKKFPAAIEDYDRVLALMASDGTLPDGTAAYVEFPDTYVQRGLAYEGLGDWEQSVKDYTKAIELWGGGRGADINPFVMSYRGNSLARLGRYEEALKDYAASADLFLATRDEGDALYARANQALALYETGAKEEAVKMMRDIVRRQPGFADMRAALAADAWGRGDLGEAETQWRITCDSTTGRHTWKISSASSSPRPSLVKELDNFLSQRRAGGVLGR